MAWSGDLRFQRERKTINRRSYDGREPVKLPVRPDMRMELQNSHYAKLPKLVDLYELAWPCHILRTAVVVGDPDT